MSDPERDLDVTQLQAAIAKTDGLLAHYRQGITLVADLKRTLVLRLIHKQHPQLSIMERDQLLKKHGVAP